MATRHSAGFSMLVVAVVIIIAVPNLLWAALGCAALYVIVVLLNAAGQSKKKTRPLKGRQDVRPANDERTLAQIMAESAKPAPPRPTMPSTDRTHKLPTNQPMPAAALRPAAPPAPPVRGPDTHTERFHTASPLTAPTASPPSYKLPRPRPHESPRWVPVHQSTTVAATTITCGMLYVGAGPQGSAWPCLIDPSLKVAGTSAGRQALGYWPSYTGLGPTQRRGYLDWLTDGRCDPAADLGFVFLYFYGLERRVIVDTPTDPKARADWPSIMVELNRLIAIYGEQPGSFRHYATALLHWMEADGAGEQIYRREPPVFTKGYELPRLLRLALGQAAVDRASLSVGWAIQWVRTDPGISLRTPARRCPELFETVFARRYAERFGVGWVLPKNRTKLKFTYSPASSDLRAASNLTQTFGATPDISALTAPVQTLQELVDAACDDLGPYSRAVGKDAALQGSIEGWLLLPASLWPAHAQAGLDTLRARMTEGCAALRMDELLTMLGGGTSVLSGEKVKALARALEAVELGFEPHVLARAKPPGPSHTVVIFSTAVGDSNRSTSAAYQTASLTLHLAASLAHADGSFDAKEAAQVRADIDRWQGLTPAEQRRLHAQLLWLHHNPPTLASMKTRLAPLDAAARERIAAYMAALAQADGVVTPTEVKFLEKIYRALDVDAQRVFKDVHAATGGVPTAAARPVGAGLRLDTARIAVLQQDTEKVTALLAGIFKDDDIPSPVPPPVEEPSPPPREVLGLDPAHAAFVRLLLSRAEWSRSELDDAAADLGLLTDGALERINDAAFDTYDAALIEGDEPMVINVDVMEQLEA